MLKNIGLNEMIRRTPMRAVEKLLATKRMLTHLSRDFTPVAFFQSLSVEDMVLADVIYADLVHQEYSNIKMFTVDTGRLPDESHQIINQLRERYGDVLKVYYPDASTLERLDSLFGIHEDYRQIGNDVRLFEPLQRALFECNAWITCANALTTSTLPAPSWMCWDEKHQLPRFNPLARWTRDEILSYSKHHNLAAHGILQHAQQTQILDSGLWWQTQASQGLNKKQHIA